VRLILVALSELHHPEVVHKDLQRLGQLRVPKSFRLAQNIKRLIFVFNYSRANARRLLVCRQGWTPHSAREYPCSLGVFKVTLTSRVDKLW
jgi:hypothetical protein